MIRVVKAIFLSAVLVAWNSIAPAQVPGGQLGFQSDTLSCAPGSQTTVPLSLRDYAGPRMTTCQFRIVSRGPFHILGIGAGSDLPAPPWALRSSVRKASVSFGGAYADTVFVVFYGPGLASGTYMNLATLTLDIGKSTSSGGTLECSQVLGADATGDDTGLRAGSVLSIRLIGPR
jgi:hypothetical protein